MHPAGPTWSYGYLTVLVVLAPAVLDGQTGASAGAAFWYRLLMFIWATIYGTGQLSCSTHDDRDKKMLRPVKADALYRLKRVILRLKQEE